jgi:hypothetical protein
MDRHDGKLEEDETWIKRMEMDYFTDDLESTPEWIFANFGSNGAERLSRLRLSRDTGKSRYLWSRALGCRERRLRDLCDQVTKFARSTSSSVGLGNDGEFVGLSK